MNLIDIINLELGFTFLREEDYGKIQEDLVNVNVNVSNSNSNKYERMTTVYNTIKEKNYKVKENKIAYFSDVLNLKIQTDKLDYNLSITELDKIWSRYSDASCAGWLCGADKLDYENEKDESFIHNLISSYCYNM